MPTSFILNKAVRLGRNHGIVSKNCQDAIGVFDGEQNGNRLLYGIICDGCSEGASSEVGANLAKNFLVREIFDQLVKGTSLYDLPEILYWNLIANLRSVVDNIRFRTPADRIDFIKNNLLFTVVGFVVTPKETLIFITGDGLYIANDLIVHVDANDEALYPGYHLVDRSALLAPPTTVLPTNFDYEVYQTPLLFRIAIGSDAWKQEQELLYQIWGLGRKDKSELQRKINRWSDKEHRFKDDVSLITVEMEV